VKLPADLEELRGPEKLAQGLVIVLPGIEGYSRLNRRIARGLAQGGVPFAIEIYDWTYGWFWQLWSLRSRRRHIEQATILASRIAEYQNQHPGRPVHLVGHSGGGAMIAFTLEALDPSRRITSGVMLVPALSPEYDLRTALSRTERGIWNFCSYGDLFFLGAGTLLCGTTDGRHCIAAGNTGFSKGVIEHARVNDQVTIRNIPYQWKMFRTGHTGGHLSVTRAEFVSREIAPLLLASD
jgi:pimeloyl-ACP methyl ester carboxylesterase